MNDLVLPGDIVSAEQILQSSTRKGPLRVGPGIRHVPLSTLEVQLAGEFKQDIRKKTVWIENSGGRYKPTTGDVVIATVHRSAAEHFYCHITPNTPIAMLPHLAFEGVSKKTRPQLASGALVYARVSSATRHLDPDLECVNPVTGKADGLGELKGGTVFDLSLLMCRRLLMPDAARTGEVIVLDELSHSLSFEVAVGRNGKIWIDSDSVKTTLLVGRAIQETDTNSLNVIQQKALAKSLLKSL